MRTFKVMLIEIFTLKKKKDSQLDFTIFDVYYKDLLSGFWKQHQKFVQF